MWICQQCRTENEPNFNFCWSCGQPRTAEKAADKIPDAPAPPPKVIRRERIVARPKPETLPSEEPPAKEAEPVPKPRFVPVQTEAASPKKGGAEFSQNIAEKPKETSAEKTVETPENIREPELFSTFIPESEKEPQFSDNGPDRERLFFTIGVRLFGLVLLFLFITGIPDLFAPVYAVLFKVQGNANGVLDSFLNILLLPLLKLLFYLISGFYLIASGRILLWLLPRGY